jgi:hypothetical protein
MHDAALARPDPRVSRGLDPDSNRALQAGIKRPRLSTLMFQSALH